MGDGVIQGVMRMRSVRCVGIVRASLLLLLVLFVLFWASLLVVVVVVLSDSWHFHKTCKSGYLVSTVVRADITCLASATVHFICDPRLKRIVGRLASHAAVGWSAGIVSRGGRMGPQPVILRGMWRRQSLRGIEGTSQGTFFFEFGVDCGQFAGDADFVAPLG